MGSHEYMVCLAQLGDRDSGFPAGVECVPIHQLIEKVFSFSPEGREESALMAK
jgi:hypothetical protein